ncbi:hypothetical protein GGP75_002404 [Salinibacter ruber]|nr:hypothetical protein [Salinibacter ruber]
MSFIKKLNYLIHNKKIEKAIKRLRRFPRDETKIKILKKVPFISMPRPKCVLDSCGCPETSFTWVSHEYQYVWYETPKCASVSLKSMLPDINLAVVPSRVRRLDDYTRFGVVRNPWAKMVSNYTMFVVEDHQYGWANDQIERLFEMPRDEISFERFIELARRRPNHHWEECYEFFPKLPDGSIDLDYIVRLENFAEDMRVIESKVGMSLDIEHRHKTDHNTYREYYSKETKKQVQKMFENDIDHFGYVY